jgi:hypothetical protein
VTISGLITTIDYRCEEGNYPVPSSCLTISNPDLLSSSETGVNSEIKKLKKALV